MALVPFPGPQSGALPLPPDDDDDDARRRRRCRFWSISTSSGNASSTPRSRIAVGVVAGFYWINQIFDFILAPTRKALPPGVKLIYTQPGEAFSLYVQIALIMGVVLAAPFIMYQVWMFIAPGPVLEREAARDPVRASSRRSASSLGAAFNHYIAFPFMMVFFASFNTPDLRVHAEARRRVRAVHEDAARHGRRLPDADRRVLPREDEDGDGAVPR